jgi:tetratricopeptide (TPR) repeat protein
MGDQGDYPKAIEYYEKSLKIKEEKGDKSGISWCLNNLGNVLSNQGDNPKAILYFEKALKISEEIGNKKGISSTLINLGSRFYSQCDYPNAILYYDKSLKIEEEIGLFVNLASDYPKLAKVYVKQQKYSEAKSLYLKAVRMKRKLIQDNFNVLSEKEKGLFLENTNELFNSIEEFSSITKIDSICKQCYNNELLLKGLLLNSNGGMLTIVSNSNDTNLTNTYWRLKQFRNKISELQSIPFDEREMSVDSLQNLANNEERKLVKLSSDFADIQKQFTYRWEDVQKNLNKDEAAIEFVRINNKLRSKNDSTTYAAFILRTGYKQPEMVSLFDEKQMQNLIKKQDAKGNDFIANLYSRGVKPLNSNIQPSGDSLYAMIWKPMLPFLKGVKTIYYAPAGMLHQIAFSAIANSKDSLISDIYDLRCVASTSVLIKDKTKDRKSVV